MLRVSVVLLSVLCVAYAAQSIGLPETKPEKFKNVPGCYIEHLDQVIPFGAFTDPTSCTEIVCGEKLIQYNSCGAVLAAPPLKLVEDKTKPYPDCCPKVKHPKKNIKHS